MQAGALDQRCAHVRDQRPGGEVQREELRAVPAGGGSPGGQIWHAGPHVDSTRGGDRGGDTGPGEPDGGSGGVAEPAEQDVQPQGEHRRARPRAAGPLAAAAEESPAGYAQPGRAGEFDRCRVSGRLIIIATGGLLIIWLDGIQNLMHFNS